MQVATSVITGDIINSQEEANPRKWLDALKSVLGEIGEEPQTWEIYRGDSFQVEVKQVEETLLRAIRIKAAIRKHKMLDVRMGIGIGEKTFSTGKITEANGSAFVHSGEAFESLKKNTLRIRSPWNDFDDVLNTCLDLALLTMDHWTANSAAVFELALQQPQATQTQMAEIMGVTQGRMSEALTRAGFDQIMKMNHLYQKLLQPKIQ